MSQPRIVGVAFTINRYGFGRWGWFKGSQRVGFNAGQLAFRVSWRREGQRI